MVEILAAHFRGMLKQQIQRSPFYGIMADETTDNSVMRQLIIYVKFLDKVDEQFVATVEYLDLVTPDSGSAEDIKVFRDIWVSSNWLDCHSQGVARIWTRFAETCWLEFRWMFDYTWTYWWGCKEATTFKPKPCIVSLSCSSSWSCYLGYCGKGYSLPRSYSRMNLYLKLSRFSGMSTNSTKAPRNERRVSKRSFCFDKSRWLNCLTPWQRS